MKKPVRVILLGEAKAFFEGLVRAASAQLAEGKTNSFELQLLRAIKYKSELMKANPFYGDSIGKSKIPLVYNASNLWRVDLPDFWRLLYTIKGSEEEIICFVIDILDHKSYDKRFGYRKF